MSCLFVSPPVALFQESGKSKQFRAHPGKDHWNVLDQPPHLFDIKPEGIEILRTM